METKNIKKISAKETRSRFNVLGIILLVFLVLYTISLFVPILWAVVSAFKSASEFRTNIIGLPKKWVWNFSNVFKMFVVRISTPEGRKAIGMGMMYVNSIMYAVGCSFFHTLCICITSYACARFNFKLSGVIRTMVIILMILPIVGNLPSEIRMARLLHIYNQVWGLWIMKANFLGMYFLVFFAMFRSLPMTYTEAAKVDGAGNFRIMVQIILPLVKYTFFTIMLINFITYWNDYQVPLIYLPSWPTIAYGMYSMTTTNENGMSSVPMRMTGAIMMLAPILLVFTVFQKRLLGNLTMGGIKG